MGLIKTGGQIKKGAQTAEQYQSQEVGGDGMKSKIHNQVYLGCEVAYHWLFSVRLLSSCPYTLRKNKKNILICY